MSARRTAPATVRTRRWPVLVLIPLLIAGAVAVQRHEDDKPVEVSTVPASTLMPVASDAAAPSSTWYCAGGTATGTKAGEAEQTIEIANLSDQAVTTRLTAVPSEGSSVEKDVPVAAHARQSVVLSSVVVAKYASAIVEADGGEVVVSHVLTGPTGTSTAACSSSPSASWYFPSGNSEKASASHQVLALFNPFPSDAVVAVTFDTDEGARAPVNFSAIVIPGHSIMPLDIGSTVTLRTQIATTVSVRSGRIIADQIQYSDGTQDTTKSLAVTPGAPQAWPTWWFADGPAGASDQTSIAVQNPSDHDVDVELQIRLDDAATNGDVDPFTFTVPAGRSVVTNVSADGRVPAGIGFTAVATATDGTPIVADRVTTVSAPEPGVTVTMGSPALSTRWFVPVASGPTVTGAAVIVTNPSATDPVTVTVSSVADGAEHPISGGDQIEIAAGQRLGLAVPVPANKPLTAVDVVTSAPVVVEARLVFKDAGLAAPLAVPVQGSVEANEQGLPVNPSSSVTLDPSATVDPDAPIDQI
ncbi:MAG: DUF5719 family protein, partial [Acidimicrobiales bacterium]